MTLNSYGIFKVQLLIIEYCYLTKIDLSDAHQDYVEQFLNNNKTHLLKNIYLKMNYCDLQKVTDNFTKDTIRINCTKIIVLVLSIESTYLSKFKIYFPHAQIY